MLKRTMNKTNVLFVCTGNTCRSAMAEALFRKLTEDAGADQIAIKSAGISAGGAMPAAANAVDAVNEAGANLSGHRSTQISRDLILWADLILCMESFHSGHVAKLFDSASTKTHLLGEYGPHDKSLEIEDPVGQPLDAYRACRDRILECLQGFLEARAGEAKRPLTICLASDSAGAKIKKKIARRLEKSECEVHDFGDLTSIIAQDHNLIVNLGAMVGNRHADCGILVGEDEQGLMMILNKFPGIRAVIGYDAAAADSARRHYNANLLILPALCMNASTAMDVIASWINSDFDESNPSPGYALIEKIDKNFRGA